MLSPLEIFFEQKDEPIKGCLNYLRIIICDHDGITEHLKYGLPFYYYNGKMFCYLWIHKKLNQPNIGFVDGAKMHHEDLLQEERAKMKILLIDPTEDIAESKIKSIIQEAFQLRR